MYIWLLVVGFALIKSSEGQDPCVDCTMNLFNKLNDKFRQVTTVVNYCGSVLNTLKYNYEELALTSRNLIKDIEVGSNGELVLRGAVGATGLQGHTGATGKAGSGKRRRRDIQSERDEFNSLLMNCPGYVANVVAYYVQQLNNIQSSDHYQLCFLQFANKHVSMSYDNLIRQLEDTEYMGSTGFRGPIGDTGRQYGN